MSLLSSVLFVSCVKMLLQNYKLRYFFFSKIMVKGGRQVQFVTKRGHATLIKHVRNWAWSI